MKRFFKDYPDIVKVLLMVIGIPLYFISIGAMYANHERDFDWFALSIICLGFSAIIQKLSK